MLVLTRHVHQSIVIGHDVVVTVLEVRGDQVRLGITAPKEVQVHREEVFAALTAANRHGGNIYQRAPPALLVLVTTQDVACQSGCGPGNMRTRGHCQQAGGRGSENGRYQQMTANGRLLVVVVAADW